MISVTAIDVPADDILATDALGPGSLLRFEYSADGGSTWSEFTTTLILAGVTEYEVHHRLGDATYLYRWRASIQNPTGAASDYAAYSPTFTPITTITSLASVRALVPTSLSDDDLVDIIAREEAILAGEVGALTGARTETFVVDDVTAVLPVRLRRPTATVTVTEGNVATTDVRLGANGRTVTRLATTGWGAGTWTGVVEVTSTPSDVARVTSWVIELVRARLAETGFDSETRGAYSYTRGSRSHDQVLAEAVADILARGTRAASRSVRSSVMSSAPATPWVGASRP